MKKTGRSFLKLAGLSAVGTTLLPGCSGAGSKAAQAEVKTEWQSDPVWRDVKYGGWKGPGVPEGDSEMDNVLMKDYAPKSSLIQAETFIPKAKYGVIDVHVHDYPGRVEGKTKEALSEWVAVQREVGVERSIVLTSATGEKFDKLADLYLAVYPDHFQLFCGLDTTDMDKPDYPERAVAELERCYKTGARGVGELSDKGFGFTRDKNLVSAFFS